MEIKKLDELTHIQRGLNLTRMKEENTLYIYKTLRSITSRNGYITELLLEDQSFSKPIIDDFITKENDILLKIVGNVEFMYIRKKDEGFVVTGNYLLIRLNENEKKSPRILFKYLKEIEFKLNTLTVGSTAMKTLTVQNIKDLEIEFSCLEKESKLDQVIALYHKELDLFDLKEQFYNSVLAQITKEEEC